MSTRRRALMLTSCLAAAAMLAMSVPASTAGPGARGEASRPEQGSAEFFAEEAQHREDAEIVGDDVSPGLYYPDDSSTPVVRVYRDPAAQLAAKEVAADDSTDAVTVTSRYTEGQIERLHAAVEDIEIPMGKMVGAGYDAKSDMFQVQGSVTPAAVAAALGGVGIYEYEYFPDAAGRDSRAADPAPHAGGATIRSSSVTCTSGVAVRASGATRMVTAGHCGSIGTSFSAGGYSHGSITHKATFPRYDLAMLSGSTYKGQIYTSSTGVTKVAAAANPGVGSMYCFSGTTSGVRCDATIDMMTGRMCDGNGCTEPVIRYTGTVSSGGDSGGPFYATGTAGVHIRGIVIGHAGQYGFAEPWGRIADRFGATIVTG